MRMPPEDDKDLGMRRGTAVCTHDELCDGSAHAATHLHSVSVWLTV